jgi:acyl carrier protein
MTAVGTGLPLSAGQRRAWALDAAEPALAVLAAAVRLTGALDVAALRVGLDWLAARHEVLRADYRLVDGAPVRLSRAPAPVPLETRDLVAGEPAQRAETLRVLLEQHARRPLLLDGGTLLRAALFRLADGEHVLALAAHRVACDEWSLALLVGELAAAYPAFAAGQAPMLPEPPSPTEHVAACAAQPDIAEPVSARSTAQLRFPLPADLAARVREVAERGRMTPFIVFLAALHVVLSRRGEDVAVAVPVAGRAPAWERLVGPLSGAAVLRPDLVGADDAAAILARVRAAALAAYDRGPEQSFVDPKLPVLAHHVAAGVSARFGDLAVEALDVRSGLAAHELALAVEEHGAELAVTVEHAVDRHDDAAAQRIAEDYAAALRWLVDQAEHARAVVAQPVVTGLPRAARAVREDVAAVEAVILAVWRELLERDDIGVDNNFFDVGGHSHLLVQVMNALRDKVDGELKVVDFFRYPTVRGLAAYLVEQSPAAPNAPAPAGPAAEPEPPRASPDRRQSLRKQRARRTARTDQRDETHAGN